VSTCCYAPDSDTTVDVERFEDLARQALVNEDVASARQALSMYGGELLPHDRYEAWAQERREQLRLRYLDLLRLDGRWETVVELDASDELAHLALMRRYAANGDRHAALRQFERMTRTVQRELGVAPGREATTLRDRLISERDVVARRNNPLLGRNRELSIAERALIDSVAGRSRTLIVTGLPGIGKSSLLAAIRERAAELSFCVGHGSSAPVEGAWPYAPVIEARACVCCTTSHVRCTTSGSASCSRIGRLRCPTRWSIPVRACSIGIEPSSSSSAHWAPTTSHPHSSPRSATLARAG
jgi:hypothetical protein